MNCGAGKEFPLRDNRPLTQRIDPDRQLSNPQITVGDPSWRTRITDGNVSPANARCARKSLFSVTTTLRSAAAQSMMATSAARLMPISPTCTMSHPCSLSALAPSRRSADSLDPVQLLVLPSSRRQRQDFIIDAGSRVFQRLLKVFPLKFRVIVVQAFPIRLSRECFKHPAHG